MKIVEKANEVKQNIQEQNLMPTQNEKLQCLETQEGRLNMTNNAKKRFLKHARHDYDVEAAISIWNNPQQLSFIRISPLGEGKDLTNPKDIENIQKKRQRGILHYNVYKLYTTIEHSS